MKILRLVLLAIGVLALVLGAMWLSGGTTPPPPVNPQKTILAETSKTIHAGWAEAETWSQKLFAEQQSDIGQMLGAGRISPTEADYLMAQSNNAAADALHRVLLAEFHRSDCRTAVVKDGMAGVDTLWRRLPGDARLQELRQIYDVYVKVARFVASSHRLSPAFNGHSWKSFGPHRSRVLAEADSYRNNAIYRRHLSKIITLRDGLAATNTRLSEAQQQHHKALYDQIVRHFNRFTTDQARLSQRQLLADVFHRFSSEIGGQLASSLGSYYARY